MHSFSNLTRLPVLLAAAIVFSSPGLALHAAPPAAPPAPAAAPHDPKVTAKGTLVTISADAVPVRQALDDLLQQTGMRITAEGGRDASDELVTYSATDVPALEAAVALLKLAAKDKVPTFGVRMAREPEGVGLSGKLSVQGPLLLVATNIVHEADFLKRPGEEERFYIKADLVVDPAFHPVTFPEMVAPALAVDDTGKSLVPADDVPDVRHPAADGSRPIDTVWHGNINIVLSRPPNSGTTIKSVSGIIPVSVATKFETIEMKDPGQIDRTVDGVKFTLKLSKDAGRNTWTISANFQRPEGFTDAQWTDRMAILRSSRMWIEGDDGVIWDCHSWGGGGATQNMIKDKHFDIPKDQEAQAPAKAVLEIATEFKRIDMHYALEDLPLP